MKKLKDSLFLVLFYSKSPTKNTDTKQKGWKENHEMNLNEKVIFVNKVTDKQLIEAHSIIDVFRREIIKTRFEDASSDDIVNTFFKKYEQDMKKAIGKYLDDKQQNNNN